MKKRHTFRKTDYLIIALIVSVFAAVIVTSSMQMRNSLSAQVENTANLRIRGIRSELQETLSNAQNSLNLFANEMEDLMRHYSTEEEMRKYIDDVKYEQILRSNGVNFNSYVASKSFVYIPDFDMPKDYYATERNWYVGAIGSAGKIYISEPYIDRMTGEICFTMSKMLSDKDTVVAMDFNLSEVQKSVEKMVGGETDYTALIVSRDGMIVGYSDMSFVGGTIEKDLPEYKDIFQEVTSTKVHDPYTDYVGEDAYTVFCDETNNGWYMILFANEDTLYGETDEAIRLRALIFVAMLSAIVALYIFGVINRGKAEKALAAKEEFLSSITKELKNPLNRIMQLSDTNRLGNSVNVKENLADIKESSLQLDGMLNNLFSYSAMAKEETSKRRQQEKKTDVGKTIRIARNVIIILFVFIIVINLFSNITLARFSTNVNFDYEEEKYSGLIESWITEQQTVLNMFANYIAEDPEILDDYEECISWMDEIARNYPEISVCYIANPYREHTVMMNNGWEPEDNWKVEERQWYKDTVLSDSGSSISAPYIDEQTGLYCITFSRIVNSRDGDFLGVFGIDCFMDKLINVLGDSYDSDGYAFITDSEGRIINHPYEYYEMTANNSVNVMETEYAKAELWEIITIMDYNHSFVQVEKVDVGVSGLILYIVSDWFYLNFTSAALIVLNTLLLILCIVIVNIVIARIIKWQAEVNLKLAESVAYATSAGNAKSQFLAQMSHEIRTPINAVIGMDEMILRESTDPQILEYANNIQTAGRSLLELVNSILDFSKIEEGKMEIIPVKYETVEIVDYLHNMIYEKAEKKGLKLVLDIDPGLPKSLFGDDVRLKQVILNILTNAVKYTHQGSVTLKMNGVEKGEDDYELFVSVKDTGIGIRPEDKDKLFVSFERLEEEKNRNIEGTGLGISIIQGLLSRMGSELEVESVYGEGSDFSFHVMQKVIEREPIGEYKLHRVAAGVKKQTLVVDERAKILVVDDNDMNIKVAKGIMKLYRIKVDTAGGGKEALNMVRQKRYDLIFLDHMMPGMDGVETFHRMEKEDLIYDTPVICLTANAITGVREKYISEGFTDYLSKPIEIAQMENILEKYLPKEYIIKLEDHPEAASLAKDASGAASGTAAGVSGAAVGATAGTSGGDGNASGEAYLSGTPMEKLGQLGFDTNAGVEYSAGMEEFYLEMVQTFANGHEEKAAEIRQDYEAQNWENYRTRVHALKSTAKMIGANNLFEAALEQEMAAKDTDPARIDAGYEPLMNLYAETVEKIKTALQ